MKKYSDVYFKYDVFEKVQNNKNKVNKDGNIKVDINSLEAHLYLRDLLENSNQRSIKGKLVSKKVYVNNMEIGESVYSNEPDGELEVYIYKNDKKNEGVYLYKVYYARYVEEDVNLPIENIRLEETDSLCFCGKKKKSKYTDCYVCYMKNKNREY